MKRILIATLLLVGCGQPSTEPDEGTSLVDKIISRAVTICHFLPTPASVEAMIGASNPTVVGLAIADAICAVIRTKPFSLLSPIYTEETCPRVNGVCVEGTPDVPSDKEVTE